MTAIERFERTGIRRLGSPKSGFRYVRPDGRPVRGGDLERIRRLGIPPAWAEVRVSPSPGSRLQAVGKDRAGRWQYRYSDAQVVARERKKHARLLAFGRALPAARAAIRQGLALPGLPRERVLACILRILSTCFLRPGSEVYAKENGSYGIATLKARHVAVSGDRVTFDFVGKAGKRQVRELRDRRVARVVRELLRVPGRQLFKFRDEDGSLVPVSPRHVNAYIKEVMGDRFSAKDFRTWSGTFLCASVLARKAEELVEGVTDRRRVITAAVRETAEQLGNTPAVCKASYIWPSVLSSFYRGKVVRPWFASVEELTAASPRRQAQGERALLDLLASGGDATPVTLAKKLDRRRRRAARPETRLARRMRSPRNRALARAFRAR